MAGLSDSLSQQTRPKEPGSTRGGALLVRADEVIKSRVFIFFASVFGSVRSDDLLAATAGMNTSCARGMMRR